MILARSSSPEDADASSGDAAATGCATPALRRDRDRPPLPLPCSSSSVATTTAAAPSSAPEAAAPNSPTMLRPSVGRLCSTPDYGQNPIIIGFCDKYASNPVRTADQYVCSSMQYSSS